MTMHDFKERTAQILVSPCSRVLKAQSLAHLVRTERDFHWVGLYDVTETAIAAIAWTGEDPPAFPTFPITNGISGAVVAEQQPVVVQDVSKDARYLTTFGQTKAEAIFPIFSDDGRVVGTIDVESDRVGAFNSDDVSFLNQCAVLISPLWNTKPGDREESA